MVPPARLALERRVALEAVTRASWVCHAVASKLSSSETLTKTDKSPVTVADFSAQAVVNHVLQQTFPDDPIVGEEDAGDLRGDAPRSQELRDRVVALVNGAFPEEQAQGGSNGGRPNKKKTALSADEILDVIDRGRFAGSSRGRQWTLDPIDGTKGFLRGGQYAVCLALIVDGKVELGVMGCPNLPVDPKKPDGEKGCLFVAVKGEGAFQRPIATSIEPDGTAGSDALERPIRMSPVSDVTRAVFCESVESGHSSHDDAAKIAETLGIRSPPVRMDSQCKYGTLARGAADIYLRLPVRKDYEENIWDHAAGCLLVQETGGRVSDVTGKPLDFSLGRTLKANKGVVAAAEGVHARVIDAVRSVLKC